MPLSVDYVYQFALKLMKKNQAGGLASVEFATQWNDSQSSYQDDLLGRFQARNNGKTGNNTGLIEDETVLQKLAPFTMPVNILIIAGAVTKPVDFVYRLALRINGNDVFKINHNQIATVNNDVIDPPSIENGQFYFAEYEDYYALLPSNLPDGSTISADLDYIKTPDNIVWGFGYDSNNRQVYDPATSIQPMWDNNSCREITKRMFVNLGVSFKDADFSNFGKTVVATGN